MLRLQEDLTSVENRIAFARQCRADAVARHDTARQELPRVLLAGVLGSAPPPTWTSICRSRLLRARP